MELNNSHTSLSSVLIGLRYASHDAFFASFTNCLASFSIAINSSSVCTPFVIIHSLNFVKQSYSFSHAKRSVVLYRSCEPEVECPCG